MKIDIDDEVVEEVVHSWLLDICDLGRECYEDDPEFWDTMLECSRGILKANFYEELDN